MEGLREPTAGAREGEGGEGTRKHIAIYSILNAVYHDSFKLYIVIENAVTYLTCVLQKAKTACASLSRCTAAARGTGQSRAWSLQKLSHSFFSPQSIVQVGVVG